MLHFRRQVIFIGAFFLINLVTAVVYSSYLSSIEQLFDEDILGARGGASSSSDPDEEAAARAAAAERAMKGPVYRCATSNALTTFVVVVICLNTVTLAMEYPGMPEGLTVALFWINVVFTIIFTVEMVLKVRGDGLSSLVWVRCAARCAFCDLERDWLSLTTPPAFFFFFFGVDGGTGLRRLLW